MSSGSYSANQDKDEYGGGQGGGSGGGQYYAGNNHHFYNEMQQPAHDGMSTQPSVGRFTEKERSNSMFSRKPATPTLPPANNSLLLSQDSASQSSSGGIVNLRAGPRAEAKMNKSVSKGKK